jgi:DNA segregation ATPase FtsK/SpoIIIE, S-DNA-T family
MYETLSSEQKQTVQALTIKMISLSFRAAFSRIETGPVITTYYFKPLPTAILAKITGKSSDLALAIGAEQISISRVRDEISITVPNKERTPIKFDSCLHYLAQHAKKSSSDSTILPILMGQNPVGEYIILDLVSQPHMLVAGSTGSGKSVFLSEIISALAILRDPQEVKFILVDTKQLDLTLFKDLDHVEQVIDKINDLYDVLDKLEAIVRDRTSKMSGLVRNITDYNKLKKELGQSPWPYYILVVDEYADIINQDRELAKEETKDNRRTRISDSIATLAQISRAAGVHIILSTQRPSTKILSGDIKANFPTRISFRLPSQFDSRVVLDISGAELLLSSGDYFYKTALSSDLQRGHSAFISTSNIGLIIAQHEQIRRSLEYV